MTPNYRCQGKNKVCMHLTYKWLKPIRLPGAKAGRNLGEEKFVASFELGNAPESLLTPCRSTDPLIPAAKIRETIRSLVFLISY
jgi:hypothetical protein